MLVSLSLMAAKLHHVLGLFLLVSSSQACGPVEYVNQVSRKASSEVEAAKAVRADKYAVYYYTLAVEYLHKAREEAAHSDYQAANRFGKRAEEAAKKARIQALERAKNPQGTSTPQLEAQSETVEFVDPSEDAGADGLDSDDPLDSDNPLKEKP